MPARGYSQDTGFKSTLGVAGKRSRHFTQSIDKYQAYYTLSVIFPNLLITAEDELRLLTHLTRLPISIYSRKD